MKHTEYTFAGNDTPYVPKPQYDKAVARAEHAEAQITALRQELAGARTVIAAMLLANKGAPGSTTVLANKWLEAAADWRVRITPINEYIAGGALGLTLLYEEADNAADGE